MKQGKATVGFFILAGLFSLLLISSFMYLAKAQPKNINGFDVNEDLTLQAFALDSQGLRITKLSPQSIIPFTTIKFAGTPEVTGVSSIEIVADIQNPSTNKVNVFDIMLSGTPYALNNAILSSQQGFSLMPGESRQISIKPIDITTLPLGSNNFVLTLKGKYDLDGSSQEFTSIGTLSADLNADPSGSLIVNLIPTQPTTQIIPVPPVSSSLNVMFRTNVPMGVLAQLSSFSQGTWIAIDTNKDGILEPYVYSSVGISSTKCADTGKILSTPTGLKVTKVLALVYVCSGTSYKNYYLTSNPSAIGIVLSNLPTEPYTSNNQEIKS